MVRNSGSKQTMEDEVIWVVSDIHLGGSGSNHGAFSDFLDWASRKTRIEIKKLDAVLQPPSKLIILGDFLELWNPLENDFKHVARQLVESLKPLLKVADEVIFVTGNHDEIMEAYAGEYPIKEPGFHIWKRHYPDEEPRYIEVGDYRYFFLHGHQFDKLFLWLGNFSRIPTFIASLNNLLMNFVPLRGWLLPALFLALLGLNLFFGWPSGLVLYFTALLSIPRIFTYLQGPIWRWAGRYLIDKPKHKDIEELVEKRYYKREKDTITSDVVVYGHTHYPEISSQKLSRQLGKTLINTGSWVRDDKPTKKNTLVTIDKRGALLLAWEGREKGLVPMDSFPDG